MSGNVRREELAKIGGNGQGRTIVACRSRAYQTPVVPGARQHRIAPNAAGVTALYISNFEGAMTRVALPHPEIRLVARFGPMAPGGVDVHAFGARERVHRKFIRGGWTVTARLQLGAHEAVLGAPVAAFVGGPVRLEDLWSDAEARRLTEQLAAAGPMEAARVLERALGDRRATVTTGTRARIAIEAAERLTHASVSEVAADLGVSERNLRRVFRETVGMGPKSFARLARFRRAVMAARVASRADWAGIAIASGYYDQAHLIADFRDLAGVTPRALLVELSAMSVVRSRT